VDYDVVVIGGGIHGVGAAQAAAAAGHSVLVIEQHALASGTSSRSSKLIHGGLRYLESGQIRLVRECLYERELLLTNAPDLVTLRPFFIPVYPQTRRRPWKLRAGLSLYAMLTGLRSSALFRTVPRSQWDTLDGLDAAGLQTVLQYWDAQTDDNLLTQAVMQSAQTMGAELWIPAKFMSAEPHSTGWNLQVDYAGKSREIHARAVVNAAGPWARRVDEKAGLLHRACDVDLVQGTHIILDAPLKSGIYYVEAPQDGRAVFVMPWYQRTLVGTTERIYQGDPAAVMPMAEEKSYLFTVLQHYFPAYRDLSVRDVAESFAGLRVLPAASGAAFSRPRETIISVDQDVSPRWASIYGGKLTAYRATAEQVMRRLQPALPKRAARGDTRRLRLVPAD